MNNIPKEIFDELYHTNGAFEELILKPRDALHSFLGSPFRFVSGDTLRDFEKYTDEFMILMEDLQRIYIDLEEGTHEYTGELPLTDVISQKELKDTNVPVYLLPNLTPNGKISEVYSPPELLRWLRENPVSPMTRNPINIETNIRKFKMIPSLSVY